MSPAPAADFLVEIGTEELPPQSLPGLSRAFADGLARAVDAAGLERGSVSRYATPRRLAARVAALALAQPDRELTLKGPPLAVAFDDDGRPSRAALAFAGKCGVDVDELGRERTPKGEWLVCRARERGKAAALLLPGIVESVLSSLPVARRMRWGDGEVEFVRPVHWVVLMHGEAPVPGRVLGIEAGNATRGHAFMAPGALVLGAAADYPAVLEERGRVVADFAARRARVVDGVAAAAREAGGTPLGDDALYDEVTALVEWPVALTGAFDDRFLELPQEVIVATLTHHQRYFPVAAADGRLRPCFVAVANLESRDPERVRHGNERVIRPRLADAAFFWDSDRKTPLAAREPQLGSVVYQRGLGTVGDRSLRIARLAAAIATELGEDPAPAERAGRLAKCDLLTGMVGEFPELQGTMGRHFARADGEPAAVAEAIGEQYLPRFAGDRLPESAAGRALAVADKLDALCGLFALGRKPSGNRDPFGLRRAALGIVRILVERRLDLDLPALIARALEAQPPQVGDDVAADVYGFIVERMRGWYLEQGAVTGEVFAAVRERRPASLADFDARLAAVSSFAAHEAAESLAAANKRIANILRQAGFTQAAGPEPALMADDAERALHAATEAARRDTARLLGERAYAEALARLAELRAPVDRFFDEVLVMTEDAAVRRNRLALLAELRALFLNVADISRLSLGKG